MGLKHTGAMIALKPQDPESFLYGSEGPDDLHVTVSYLGKAADLDDERRGRIMEATQGLANSVPIKCRVIGPAYFKEGGCTVLLLDSPELRALADHSHTNIGNASTFPGFTPHMTIDYGDDPLDLSNYEIPDEIVLDKLQLKFGDESHYFDGLMASAFGRVKRIWNEALHPRAKDGKFITKGGWVKGPTTFLDHNKNSLTKYAATQVEQIDTKNGMLRVRDKYGRPGVISIKNVESAAAPKASIDAPPAPMSHSQKFDSTPVFQKPHVPKLTPEQRFQRDVDEMHAQAKELGPDPIQRAKILNKIMGGKVGSPLTTAYVYNKRGASRDMWDEDRMAQHEELWDAFITKIGEVGIPQDRKAVIIGGPPGAGKSYSLQPGEPAGQLGVVGWDTLDVINPNQPPTHVVINPDVLKEMMVERGMLPDFLPPEIRPREAVSLIHAESNFLSQMFMQRIATLGYNVAYDSTMANIPHVKKNIAPLALNDYRFSGLYVHVPKEESRVSTLRRFIEESESNPVSGGRFVPSEASSTWDTEGTFDSFKSWFEDGWMKIDNTGLVRGEPKKERYEEGVGSGEGLIKFVTPGPPKPYKRRTPPGGVVAPTKSAWTTGPSVPPPAGPPEGGAVVSSGTAVVTTDHQLAQAIFEGEVTPDEALMMLSSGAILVTEELRDEDEYVGASFLQHEIHRAGRGGLALDFDEVVAQNRLDGWVHD